MEYTEEMIKPILERFSLTGKTALVTGAAQGIGKAFAEALYQAGATVAILDLNLEKAENTAAEIGGDTDRVIALKCDVTKEDDFEKTLGKVLQHWGDLTIAVNNAGIGVWSAAELQDVETWNRVVNLNLTGVYLCCKHEGLHMLENGYGKIINTASMSGHIVNWPQKQSAYNTSKAGVIHLTQSLAIEWAEKGVRVNSISPGYTRTKLVDDLLETPIGKNMLPLWLERIPQGKMAEVTDLQGALIYLASEASDYMTGHDMIVDGGYCSL
jgi:NAD(P)-dependent dehydrogenase (short-subunit alcohol dehydrogenase family)